MVYIFLQPLDLLHNIGLIIAVEIRGAQLACELLPILHGKVCDLNIGGKGLGEEPAKIHEPNFVLRATH